MEKLSDFLSRNRYLHDAEIRAIRLESAGPTLFLEVEIHSLGHDGATGNSEKVAMRFDVVENLTIADFNYQNVISTMTLNLVMGHRLYSAELIPRMRVDIESVFGATLSFTCDGGEIT